MSFRVSSFVLVLGLATGLGGASREASAAPVSAKQNRAVNEMVALNKKALTAYKAKKGEAARDHLLAAVSLGKKNGLSTHDMMARTYLHLAVVHIESLDERDKGMRYFEMALTIRPDIQLTPSLVKPSLEAALDEARDQTHELVGKTVKAGPVVVSADADGGGDPPARGRDKETTLSDLKEDGNEDGAGPPKRIPEPLYCPTPEDGPPEHSMSLHCAVQPGARAAKVVLYYRPTDADQFTSLAMARDPKGWYTAVIPARAVTGKALEFYVEARGTNNKVAATNGDHELPNVIRLRAGAPPVGLASAGLRASESAIEAGARKPSDTEASVDADLRADAAEEAESGAVGYRKPGAIWVGLGVGTGYGAHLKRFLENHSTREAEASLRPGGLLVLTPEVGLQYDRRLSLSLQSRHQFITPSGQPDPVVPGDAPKSAHALFARVHYELWNNAGSLQLQGTATVGGGSGFRLKVKEDPAANLVSSDTIAGGPLVLGPGVELFYYIDHKFILVLEARMLLGFTKLAAVLDGSLGVQYTF
jgi:hypothetical protein